MLERTPRVGESCLVNVEFWFGQTTSGYSATGIRYLLDVSLGFEKLVDLSAQGNIFLADDFFGDHLENKRSVTDPSIEIVGVNGARAGNHYPGLMAEIFGSDEKRRELERRRGRRTFAPDELGPSGPMLAKRPDLTIGDSFAMYDSTVVCPKAFVA